MISARAWLFSIAGMSALSGLVGGLSTSDQPGSGENAATLIFLPIHVLTYLWMKADSREMATPSPPGATPLIVGLYPVAVPYHLIATRTGWGKATAMLWLLGFVVLLMALNVLTSWLGYFLVAGPE